LILGHPAEEGKGIQAFMLWKNELSVENTQDDSQVSAPSDRDLISKLGRWAGHREKIRRPEKQCLFDSFIRTGQEFSRVLPRSLEVYRIEQYPQGSTCTI
jgi:hypothetical protein